MFDQTILIIEDEALTAVDISDEVTRRGLQPVLAPTLYEALERLRYQKIVGAIVSNRVGGRISKPARCALRAQGIPLIMQTTNVRHLSDKPFPVFLKPAPPRAVVARLARELQLVIH